MRLGICQRSVTMAFKFRACLLRCSIQKGQDRPHQGDHEHQHHGSQRGQDGSYEIASDILQDQQKELQAGFPFSKPFRFGRRL